MYFGHGFIPRVDARNATAVDRALGAPGQLALDAPEIDLPWVIIAATGDPVIDGSYVDHQLGALARLGRDRRARHTA